jgi:hypothetical protein
MSVIVKASIGINFEKFNPKYSLLIQEAVKHMQIILYSEYFYKALFDELEMSNNCEGELSEWKNKSANEIFQALFPITLYLNTYYTVRDVIGYGNPGTNKIYLNTKYLDMYNINNLVDLMRIGSNLLHEHSHDCGFSHDFYPTKRRPNSLSYILNRAYETAFRQYYNLPRPVIVIKAPWYRRVLRKVKQLWK